MRELWMKRPRIGFADTGGLLFGARHDGAACGGQGKPGFANPSEQGGGEFAVDNPARLQWPQIRPRPRKAVGFGQHNPRPFVIEPEALLGGRWNLDGMRRIGGRRVGDRQDDDLLITRLIGHRQQHRAGPLLRPFLDPLRMLAPPEIGVSNDHAGHGFGKRHASGFGFVIERFRTG